MIRADAMNAALDGVYKTVETVQNKNAATREAFQTVVESVHGKVSSVTDQFEAVVAGFEAEYCTQPSFKPCE